MPSHGTDSAASSRDSGSDTNGGSALPPFETSPFTDWREQLRERVKEIRARKLADKRRGDDHTAPAREQADAAREEKLRVARSRAASARTPVADPVPTESREPVAPSAELAPVGVDAELHAPSEATDTDDAADEPEVFDAEGAAKEAEPQAELGAQDTDDQEVDAAASLEGAAGAEDDLQEATADEIAAAAREALERIRAEAAGTQLAGEDAAVTDDDFDETMGPPPTDAPAFAEDDLEDPIGDATLAPMSTAWESPWDEDDPVDEVADDESVWVDEPQEAEAAAAPSVDPDAIDLNGVPAWARARQSPDAPEARHAQALPPDLEAIPAELKDVPIPSWAIPRRAEQRQPQESATAPGSAEPKTVLESSEPEASELATPDHDAAEIEAPETHVPGLDEPNQPVETTAAREASTEPTVPTRFRDGRRKIADLLPWDDEEPDNESVSSSAAPRDTAPEPATGAPEQESREALTTHDEDDADGRDDEHGDDDLEPPSCSPPPAGGDTGRNRLDDVYLVGEFTGRRGADAPPSAAAGRQQTPSSDPLESVPLNASGPSTTAASEERDPRDGLHEAAYTAPSPVAADEEPRERHAGRQPIPNLYEDDEEEPEAGPTPFRGLFEESLADGESTTGAAATGSENVDDDVPASQWGDTEAGLELDLDGEPPAEGRRGRDPLDPSAPVTDRVFSALADGMVVLLLGLALGLAGASAAGTGMLSFVRSAPLPFVAAWLIFAFSYGVFFVGTCGQTIGKMAMRVRVIGADRFQVGYAKATRRALLYALAALPVGLGLLLALKDPKHRGLHDRLSGTRVVKA